uniref:Uncharacterized protein n=1 Tax=Dinoroseobacter phage vB_DshS_R26L TaxID=3161158 RepID=A0AAU7VGE9_9CAUD
MSIFNTLMNKILGTPDPEGPVPGAMGKILAGMGIHEIKPAPKGIPVSVLNGCKQELVLVPGMSSPAYTKEGKPVMARDKHGRVYHVMDNYAIPKKRWKQMQREQARKEAGRWYSGAKVA